ncbi:hypothetical protein BKA93DRAFT_788079 [Sparassis latifolia]
MGATRRCSQMLMLVAVVEGGEAGMSAAGDNPTISHRQSQPRVGRNFRESPASGCLRCESVCVTQMFRCRTGPNASTLLRIHRLVSTRPTVHSG